MELIEIGKVVKLHGYLGQMKVNSRFDDDFDINKIDVVFDEEKTEYKVSRIFKNTDGFVVALEGVDLEKSKIFIGKMLLIDRSLVDGKILFEDLKGSDISFESSDSFAKIVDVQDFGTAEVIYCMSNSGTEFIFPNAPGVIKSFDYKTKKLVLDENKFREVCDYEN